MGFIFYMSCLYPFRIYFSKLVSPQEVQLGVPYLRLGYVYGCSATPLFFVSLFDALSFCFTNIHTIHQLLFFLVLLSQNAECMFCTYTYIFLYSILFMFDGTPFTTLFHSCPCFLHEQTKLFAVYFRGRE